MNIVLAPPTAFMLCAKQGKGGFGLWNATGWKDLKAIMHTQMAAREKVHTFKRSVD